MKFLKYLIYSIGVCLFFSVFSYAYDPSSEFSEKEEKYLEELYKVCLMNEFSEEDFSFNWYEKIDYQSANLYFSLLYPEFFWVKEISVSEQQDMTKITVVINEKYRNISNREKMKRYISEQMDQYLKEVEEYNTPLQKEIALFYMLCQDVEYTAGHNGVDSIVMDKKAGTMGFIQIFHYLMKKIGILSVPAIRHQGNQYYVYEQVCFDGCWYNVSFSDAYAKTPEMIDWKGLNCSDSSLSFSKNMNMYKGEKCDKNMEMSDVLHGKEFYYKGEGSVPVISPYFDDLDTKNRYNYSNMTEQQKKIYDMFLAVCNDIQKNKTDIPMLTNKSIVAGQFITTIPYDHTLFHETYTLFAYDYPEFFWLNGIECHEVKNGNFTYLKIICNECYKDGRLRRNLIQAMDKEIASYLELTKGISSEEKREGLLVHEMCKRIQYKSFNGKPDVRPISHDVVGVLLNREGVCEGYAKLFQLLMVKEGIFCNRLVGMTGIKETDSRHTWNQVRLNGKWYNIDVTFMDNKKGIYSYRQFNQDDNEKFLKSHIPEENVKKQDCHTIYDRSNLFHLKKKKKISSPFGKIQYSYEKVKKYGTGDMIMIYFQSNSKKKMKQYRVKVSNGIAEEEYILKKNKAIVLRVGIEDFVFQIEPLKKEI